MDLQGQQPYRDVLTSALLCKHKFLLVLTWLGPDWYSWDQVRANPEGINKLLLDYEQVAQTSSTPIPVEIVSCPSTHQQPPTMIRMHNSLKRKHFQVTCGQQQEKESCRTAAPLRDDTEGQGEGQASPGRHLNSARALGSGWEMVSGVALHWFTGNF